ncbi:MAG: oxygen-independent coproporphyrinogen III oxidase-like protein [Gammaproteobacteria bacterium]|nr:oxygen-independent coproporphyrinogen III oxidase-like protein [Gammaproteobacteria bacterium]
MTRLTGEFPGSVPLSLYVHIPWCIRKCPYCDFNSHALKGELSEQRYMDALLRDLEQDLPRVWGRRVGSVFIGGGTPSLLSPESLDRLLSGLRARLTMLPDAEITLEANPGTAEADRFSGYRKAGVNRLSIGVQSFNNQLLKGIGRIHGGEEAIRAVEMAQGAGFDTLNLDLMYGLPGQSVVDAVEDLTLAISLETVHISHYQLTLEPNTRFHSEPPVLPEEDVHWDMQQACQEVLKRSGFGHYEVSAYARPGSQCRHNLNYWRFGDYIGIGAGAHAKLSHAVPRGVTRFTKHCQPEIYMEADGSFVDEEWELAPQDLIIEFMLNGLRLSEGVPTSLFNIHTGLAPEVLAEGLAQAREQGLMEDNATRLLATPRGWRYLNELLELFTP